jgi:hypothetical protein
MSHTGHAVSSATVLSSWEAFEAALAERQADFETRAGYRTALLFRGHADAGWGLDTTLERAGQRGMKLSEYHRVISTMKAEVESFTERAWEIPAFPAVREAFSDYDRGSRELWQGNYPAYDFLTHLRHHGFPSPLLDWSRSPYVAAFFAFRRPERDSEFVSIFLYDERPANIKSSDSRDPIIHRFGPNVRTHRRHFLQQSEYTVAARFDREWEFAPHKAVFDLNAENQDLLTKFDISVSERNKVIKRLDSFNLNASSLFGSEDSLMETLATRRFG